MASARPQDHGRALPPLRLPTKLSYAAGEVASNLAWNMVASFLLFYYTDVALLPVASLGTLMLVTRLMDAVFDPTVGVIVDATRTRWGKARPYLLWMPLPFAILCAATFAVPALPPGGKIAYAYVTFAVLGLCYSLLYIPYSALLPMLTRVPDEKFQLGSFRAMGTSIASIFVYSLTLPAVALIGGGDRRLGFTTTAAIMGGITALLYFVTFFNCPERWPVPARSELPPLGQRVRQMGRNPVWRIGATGALLNFTRLGVMVSITAFFCKNVLGRPGVISLILPLLSVAILTGGFIARFLFGRLGLRRGNIAALCCALVALVLLPLVQGELPLFIALFMIANVCTGTQGATMFILMADSADLHEEMFGVRAEGLLVSSMAFGLKVGMAIGAALAAYALSWAGYDPLHVSDRARRVIASLFYGVPIAISLLQIVNITRYRFDHRLGAPA